MKNDQVICLHVNRELMKEFRLVCVKKEVTVSDAIRKLLIWVIEKETGKKFYLDDYEKIKEQNFKNIVPDEIVRKKKFSEEDIIKMVQLRCGGMSYTQIANQYGAARTSVVREIKRVYGVRV